MADHNILGEKGENIAWEFLQKQSFEILEKSWRYKHKEIDIIAKLQNILIFVEVKTRSSNYWGEPHEFVSIKKQKFLIEASNSYIDKMNFNGEVRFDIVSIIFSDEAYKIEHIVNAFYPY
jgi:putative endonuclease